jgi:hypothetical protein
VRELNGRLHGLGLPPGPAGQRAPVAYLQRKAEISPALTKCISEEKELLNRDIFGFKIRVVNTRAIACDAIKRGAPRTKIYHLRGVYLFAGHLAGSSAGSGAMPERTGFKIAFADLGRRHCDGDHRRPARHAKII